MTMRLFVKDINWNDRVERLLNVVSPLVGVENIKRKVDIGDYFINEVVCNDISIGIYIARVDLLINGDRELVVMHAISDVKGPKPLIHILSNIFPNVGLQYSCKRVRIHSDTNKMDDLLKSAGFKYMESVFVKEV